MRYNVQPYAACRPAPTVLMLLRFFVQVTTISTMFPQCFCRHDRHTACWWPLPLRDGLALFSLFPGAELRTNSTCALAFDRRWGLRSILVQRNQSPDAKYSRSVDSKYEPFRRARWFDCGWGFRRLLAHQDRSTLLSAEQGHLIPSLNFFKSPEIPMWNFAPIYFNALKSVDTIARSSIKIFTE